MHGNIQWVGISDYDGRRERGGERSRLYRIHMTKFPTCTSPGSLGTEGVELRDYPYHTGGESTSRRTPL